MNETPAPQPRSARSNLQTRVISAVVLAAAVLVLTWLGGVWFRLLAVAIGAAIVYEWATMAGAVASTRYQIGTWLLAAMVLMALALGTPAWLLFSAAIAGSVALWAYARIAGEKGSLWLALPYATLPAVALAFLRGADTAGIWAMLFLFAVVWATDILAYFVGRAVGGPKLAPSISPGKTWSGALGGAIAGAIAGAAVIWFVQPYGIVPGLVVALVLSVISQAGDLFESALKRRFGVKDSSSLIPGHGGVMDRADGLVAAALALYLLGALVGSADMPAQALFG